MEEYGFEWTTVIFSVMYCSCLFLHRGPSVIQRCGGGQEVEFGARKGGSDQKFINRKVFEMIYKHPTVLDKCVLGPRSKGEFEVCLSFIILYTFIHFSIS